MAHNTYRQPCPGRIFEDLGVGFAIGTLGGTVFYFLKGKLSATNKVGAWNSPRNKRFMGELVHIRNRAPLIGGSFAMWGGCFASLDCLLLHYRQRDDPMNAVMSGFLTGGILAFRSGPQAALKNAFIGGFMLCLIEGVTVMITQYSMRMQQQMQEEQMKIQRAELEKMMRRGGTDPWAVDFNKDLSGRDLTDNTETLSDPALSGQGKSFSF